MNGVELMERFKELYPKAREFTLPTTYRCSKAVTNAGNQVADIIDRTVIDTANLSDGSIKINTEFHNQRAEANFVCGQAIQDFNDGRSVKILYRANAQSLVYQQLLLKENIPFSINQTNSIFNTKEARLALACCNIIFEYNEYNITAKANCIQDLKPLISNKWGLYAITKKMKESNTCPLTDSRLFVEDGKTEEMYYELTSFVKMLKNKQTIQEIVHFVAESIEENVDFSDSAYDNLIGIEEFIADCNSMDELRIMIDSISKPRILLEGERAIALSTIHGVKGLDADVIFLTGVADGLLPHKRSEDVMEELNLFYVGVTRARENLYVTGFRFFGKNEYVSHSYVNIINKGENVENIGRPAH